MVRTTLLGLLLGVCWCVQWAGAAENGASVRIQIDKPSPGQAIFDQTEIAVSIESTEPIERVELTMDGQRIDARPMDEQGVDGLPEVSYRWLVDVGPENRERRIEVVVFGPDGALGSATRTTPRIAVHEQLEVELQQLYVTVSRRSGERVLDLEPGDFRIVDEGRAQQLVTFARGDIPFTALIMIDGSGSMHGRQLRTSLVGAHRFVHGMRPLDEAKLMVFSDRLLAITPWSGDSAPLAETLNTVEDAGGTAVLDHLHMALTLLEARQGRRVVILLSDGWDAHSVLETEQIRQVARRSQALIYWVRLTAFEPSVGRHLGDIRGANPLVPVHLIPTNSWRDAEASRELYERLERVVKESGGRIVSVPSLESVELAFEDILAELRQQYALGYDPEPRRNDGSWRPVVVDVTGRGLNVRARDGYVDR